MPHLPHLHTLGDYRDAIERFATYPGAGTANEAARTSVTLGLYNSMVGDISGHYEDARSQDHGVLTQERLESLKAEMGNALFHLTRSIVEFSTNSGGLLWGQDLSELHEPVQVDNPAHAWLAVPRIVVQTDFSRLFDVQSLLRTLSFAAARHGWTLQDLARTNVRTLMTRDGSSLAGAAL
jgi:hypothetical protein